MWVLELYPISGAGMGTAQSGSQLERRAWLLAFGGAFVSLPPELGIHFRCSASSSCFASSSLGAPSDSVTASVAL